MSDAENVGTGTTPGEGTESVQASVAESSSTPTQQSAGAGETNPSAATPEALPVPATPAYMPNYKYKAALQEKELDKFWHPLIKDAESEKKVKEIFTKVDAFDHVQGKRSELEKNLESLSADYQQTAGVVQRFNASVKANDLSSAFRLAGITKDQVFKWAQHQLALMEMPPEQRAQMEQYEASQYQKSELEQQVSSLQQQFEQQAVLNRTMQLDVSLGKPEVASFAAAWDTNSGSPGSFRQLVIDEAKRVYYETNQDLSPDQAISQVMQRFGKFLSVGDTTSQAPQVLPSVGAKPPVIPHIAGKAASPIKKVPQSLDDLKKLARSIER